MSWIAMTVDSACEICKTEHAPIDIELELGKMNSVQLPCGCLHWFYLPTIGGNVPGGGLPLSDGRRGLRLIRGGKEAA